MLQENLGQEVKDQAMEKKQKEKKKGKQDDV